MVEIPRTLIVAMAGNSKREFVNPGICFASLLKVVLGDKDLARSSHIISPTYARAHTYKAGIRTICMISQRSRSIGAVEPKSRSTVVETKVLNKMPDGLYPHTNWHSDTAAIVKLIETSTKPVVQVRMDSPAYAHLRADSIRRLKRRGRVKCKKISRRGDTIWIQIR